MAFGDQSGNHTHPSAVTERRDPHPLSRRLGLKRSQLPYGKTCAIGIGMIPIHASMPDGIRETMPRTISSPKGTLTPGGGGVIQNRVQV